MDNQTISTYDNIIYSYDAVKEIENDWERFPWKLDYILYILFSEKDYPRDIAFILKNDRYVINTIRNKNFDTIGLNLEEFPIDKNELLNCLGINPLIYNDFIQFYYKSQLFNQPLEFQGQKSLILKDSLILLRYKANENTINIHDFHDRYKRYFMYYDLNETLPAKNTSSMRIKI